MLKDDLYSQVTWRSEIKIWVLRNKTSIVKNLVYRRDTIQPHNHYQMLQDNFENLRSLLYVKIICEILKKLSMSILQNLRRAVALYLSFWSLQ